MRTFAVTELISPPFPARLSEHVEEAATRSMAWATRLGLITSADDRRRLLGAETADLAGRACPEASPDQLGLLNDLFIWLFTFDDRCDDDGLGEDPARLSPTVAGLLDVLDLLGEATSPTLLEATGPLGQSLHDLCRRVRAHREPQLLLHFVDQVRQYLLALLWEATNRAHRRVPGEAEYIQMRRHTGAVHPSFTLTDVAHGVPVGARWRADPGLSALDRLAADLVCWCNDLFSYDKERRVVRDGHNLVTVIARTGGRDERARRGVPQQRSTPGNREPRATTGGGERRTRSGAPEAWSAPGGGEGWATPGTRDGWNARGTWEESTQPGGEGRAPDTAADEELALVEAAARFNTGLAMYLRLEAAARAEGDPAVSRFLAARRCWIRGTYDWSMRAGRYR